IKDVLAIFSEMGVNVVETEETSKEGEREEGEELREEADEEDRSESSELVEVQQKVPAKSEAKEPTERTDDPVRMYLREMRPVKLLSREGEIAIAKRIEAGREAMIVGLCENPLTSQAIIIWRDELNEGKVFLRDIIDLSGCMRLNTTASALLRVRLARGSGSTAVLAKTSPVASSPAPRRPAGC